MARVVYCVKGPDGYCHGDASEERADFDHDAMLAHVGARMAPGWSIVDLEAPGAVHPPKDPALMSALTARATKTNRLSALRAKGWANLTLVERNEARALAFDLGEPSPPAA